jgi:hypothetical protein
VHTASYASGAAWAHRLRQALLLKVQPPRPPRSPTRPHWPPARPARPVRHCPPHPPRLPHPARSSRARRRAPAALRERIVWCPGTGRTHPPSSAPDAARVQVPRHPAGQTGALQGSGVQCCTGKTVSSTITAMLVQILAVKLALPSGLPLLRGRSA